jgi:YegS/Rv2252/BmrU family lipid kinase
MIALIINGGSGADDSNKDAHDVEARLRAAGHEVRLTLSKDPEILGRGADDAITSKAEAVIAGGGDGTICLVSGKLAGSGIPLGVLPMGTLNHFAKDLGLPLELDKAVEVILAGHTELIDVGEVNGRVFINNSSLGLYPAIVRLRERNPARGWRKWPVAFAATVEAMKKQPKLTITVKVEGEDKVHRTPIFFVGNNAYQARGLKPGVRESLTEGHLALYIVELHRRGDLARLAWRMVRGKAEESDWLEVVFAEEALVETTASKADVSRDGEVEQLKTPLRYRIRPKALKVFVSKVEMKEGDKKSRE